MLGFVTIVICECYVNARIWLQDRLCGGARVWLQSRAGFCYNAYNDNSVILELFVEMVAIIAYSQCNSKMFL
jgi:hypothetical protein